MRSVVVAVLSLLGCEHASDMSQSPPPDARPDGGMVGQVCGILELIQFASCHQTDARTNEYRYYNGYTSHTMCMVPIHQDEVQCTSGCAVEGDFQLIGETPLEVATFVLAPAVLCAETPEAQVGASCDSLGAHPCLPTRAHLNADGTVAGQDYLACGSGGTCVAAAAPVVPNYLEACDAAVLSFGSNAAGAVGLSPSQTACLLAWDSATSRVASGRTRTCIGDWQCPASSLCDGSMIDLSAVSWDPGRKISVCKPGPRGMLTPAMLSF